MRTYKNLFNKIIQPGMLFLAWEEFKKEKSSKLDVLLFEQELERNIFKLATDLEGGMYKHDKYAGFYISDPKPRHIHKATVRDRVLHHAIFNVLNPIFEPTFIPNSFSCRVGKGSHKGVLCLRGMLNKESRNNTRTCYVLKCDVRKFFDSVDHDILIKILDKKIKDEKVMNLMREIVGSFNSEQSDLFCKKGVPIGNLTSQIFSNFYMNEFDQFIKHKLKVKYYARYTDDFIVVSKNKEYLVNLIPQINEFLNKNLELELHPKKVEIIPYHKGVDFLGYVVFPHHILVRKKTKKRIVNKLTLKLSQYQEGIIEKKTFQASLQSYLGVLSHANAYQFSENLKNNFLLID
ncbi:MAG: reverse transcriptase/maturase family protein [Candidatus Nomurabacteria bacterium]|nr:reverse transcriptase/maturase family protein [Candidatus Nomurabacteria bacterium]